jgi:asparagine synthase (glutamine-hydrolysing)
MCGIAVVLDGRAAPGLGGRLLRMHEALAHRGPDGEGFLLVDPDGAPRRIAAAATVDPGAAARLAVAFRRLSILDLTDAAAQPLASPDFSRWIVFNGEIYNFRELRQELTGRGRTFRSRGDAEVVLAAFEAWGEAAFERLEGMWAAVVLDLPARRLVASRDRFGIKPLYWAVDGPRLLLASEAKAILAAREERPRAERRRVAQFLRGRRLPCLEDSFFEGIRSVPPGTWFEVPLDDRVAPPAFRRYWDLGAFACLDPGRPLLTYAAAVDAFRGRLTSAVASHLTADVPVGSLLSGGLDSAAVVAIAAPRLHADRRALPTFTVGSREDPAIDELRFVDAMVSRFSLVNHREGLGAAWLAASAGRLVRALEEPPLSLAAAGQYRVFQMARERGVTVVLDGQGADEILAGYPYHERALLLDRARRGRINDVWRELRAVERKHRVGLARVAYDFFLAPALRRARALPWLASDYAADRPAAEDREAPADRGRDPSLVNRRLHYDVKWGNAKLILAYGDKAAMASSVEARVPYFDRALVELAFQLPDDYKVSGGDRKRVLRDAVRGVVPAEITERPDRLGFAVPEARLVREALWPAARDVLASEGVVSSPCFQRGALRRFLDDYGAGRHDDARAVWRLYAFALWMDAFGVTVS